MAEKLTKKRKRNPNGVGNYRVLRDGRYAWRKTEHGDTIEISAKTPKELQEKVNEIANLPIIKSKFTVAEWFEKWLETYVKPLKKEATYNQYNDIYRTHIKPAIGKKKMREVESFDIQGVIAKMAQYKKKIRKKNKETGKIEEVITDEGLSSCTMKHCRKIMSIAFAKAKADKIIAVNPVEGIEIPVKQAKPRKTLTVEELSKIFVAMENSRWIWSIKFDLVTGMRRGELLAMKWSDIDEKNKRITVDKSNSLTGLGDTKSAKIHYVPLSDKAREYLEGQKAMLKKEFNPNEELVFPNNEGKMMLPNSYYTMLSRFAKKAGIKASPHCLRHTFVYFTKGDLTLEEIQKVLGHSSKTQTLEIYGDMIKDTSKETAKQIDSVFDNLDSKVEETKREERAKTAKDKIRKDGNVIEIEFGKAN